MPFTERRIAAISSACASARGPVEIVYDDGVTKRLVWQETGVGADPDLLREVLARAVRAARVVPALHAELKRRAINVEMIAR